MQNDSIILYVIVHILEDILTETKKLDDTHYLFFSCYVIRVPIFLSHDLFLQKVSEAKNAGLCVCMRAEVSTE